MVRHRIRSAGRPHTRHGNTLILIVVIALFAVAAVMYFNASGKEPAGPVEECPWVEIERIAEDISMINLPGDSQKSLEEPISFTQSIKSDEGENRGRITIEIDPSGLVAASWKAKYKEDNLEKEFNAGCSGNVDSTMVFEDENGVDEDKLFFLTQGTFILQAFKQGNARAGGGQAYIVGWLSPDGSSQGSLVLAPDKKTTKVYRW